MALLDKLKIGGTVYDAWATKDQISAPFANAIGNVLTLHMVTLKQMKDLLVQTSAGDVRFSITTDADEYYLAFSSDSPQAIAGQAIEDDTVVLYDNEIIFEQEVITFPTGWTISGVYLAGIDGNLLCEGDAWRLAEIQRAVKNINVESADQVAEFFGLPEALPGSYVPASTQQILTELENIWQEVTGEMAPLESFVCNNFRREVHNGVVSYHDIDENVLG